MQFQLLGSNRKNKMTKRCVYIYVGMCSTIGIIYATISFWICIQFFDLIALVVCFTSFFLSTSVFGTSLSIYSFFIFNIQSRYCLLNDILRFVSNHRRGWVLLNKVRNYILTQQKITNSNQRPKYSADVD